MVDEMVDEMIRSEKNIIFIFLLAYERYLTSLKEESKNNAINPSSQRTYRPVSGK